MPFKENIHEVTVLGKGDESFVVMKRHIPSVQSEGLDESTLFSTPEKYAFIVVFATSKGIISLELLVNLTS
jgi:hypothetical protein